MLNSVHVYNICGLEEMYQTIGIVGGLSPESTANYYLSISHRHFEHFQDHYYPSIKIASVCRQQYVDWRLKNRWDLIAEDLSKEFCALANAGVSFVLVACNTVHKALPMIQSPVPVLSIVDVAAWEIQQRGIDKLILTGTQFTMSDGFFSQQLSNCGIEVITPNPRSQNIIDRIIKTELTLGKATPESATAFEQVIHETITRESYQTSTHRIGVLLACTELGMLLPYLPPEFNGLDTAELHALSAWKIATNQLPPPW